MPEHNVLFPQITQADVVEAYRRSQGRKLARVGSEYKGVCPVCDGEDRFYVRTNGRYFCRQCCDDGKDKPAFLRLKDALGLSTPRSVIAPRESAPRWHRELKDGEGPKASPAPGDSIAATVDRPTVRRWRYTGPDGGRDIVRTDYPEHKQIRWGSQPQIPPARLLFPAKTVTAAPVYFAEGAKAADAIARAVNASVIGTASSSTTPDAATLTHHLAALRPQSVRIWPDADPAGEKHADAIARSVHDLGYAVSILTPSPSWPDGHDAADLETREQVAAIIADASRWEAYEPLKALMPWSEFLDAAEPDWLVKDTLERGAVALIVGEPKAGKSSLVEWLVCTLAGYGTQAFLERETVASPQPVAFYFADAGLRRARRRYGRLIPPDAGNVHPIRPEADWLGIIDVIRSGRFALVVLDTLGRAVAGELSSDDYHDWQPLLASIRDAAEDGDTAVVLVHHSRKSGGDAVPAVLGSQALAGGADDVFLLTVRTDPDRGEPVRTIRSTTRDGIPFAGQELVHDPATGAVTIATRFPPPPTATDPRREVARTMAAAGYSQRRIASTLDTHRTQVRKWVHK